MPTYLRRVLASEAVFDLAHLDGLSDAPDLVLLVSERTVYLLLNLIIADVAQAKRYAVDFTPQHYVPLVESDPEHELFKSVVAAAHLEVQEMATLQEWLTHLDKRVAPVHGDSHSLWAEQDADDPLIFVIGPVPDDEMWHVTQFSSRISSGPVTSIYHNILHVIMEDVSHTIDGPVTMESDGDDGHSQGSWWLMPGDYCRAFWYGTTTSTEGWLRVAYSAYALPLEE